MAARKSLQEDFAISKCGCTDSDAAASVNSLDRSDGNSHSQNTYHDHVKYGRSHAYDQVSGEATYHSVTECSQQEVNRSDNGFETQSDTPTSNSRISCRFTGCAKTFQDVKTLRKHLNMVHKVKKDPYACHICMEEGSKSDIEVHLEVRHESKITPKSYVYAMAMFYRDQSLKDVTRFMEMHDQKWNENDEKADQRFNRQISDENMQASLQLPESSEIEAKSSQACCHVCHASMARFSKKQIIQHHYKLHGIVIDLSRCQDQPDLEQRIVEATIERDVNASTNTSQAIAVDINENNYRNLSYQRAIRASGFLAQHEHGLHEDELDNECYDTDADSGPESERLITGDDMEFSNHGIRNDTGKTLATVLSEFVQTPSSMAQLNDSQWVRESLIACFKKDKIQEVEMVLGLYETRSVQGQQWRVNKNSHQNFNHGDSTIAYAVAHADGWYCGVPCCGAVVDEAFIIDLHLYAHGPGVLSKWYCGDTTCASGKERVFNDAQHFRLHVNQEHFASKYSFAAGRQVPSREVLTTLLTELLDIPLAEVSQDDKSPLRSFESVRTDKRPAKDSGIIPSGPLKRRGFNEDAVRDEDVNNNGDTSEQVLKIDDAEPVPFKDDPCNTGKRFIRRDVGSLNRLLQCPWHDCRHKSTIKAHIALHILSSHLMCMWQCPEQGCEHCGYHSQENLERHRMFCHVGSPLQCGHDTCTVAYTCTDTSRGYIKDSDLRRHFEKYLNAEIPQQSSPPSSRGSEWGGHLDVKKPVQEPLPDETQYRQRFMNGSSVYFTEARKDYRRKQNLQVLSKQKVYEDNVTIRGQHVCTGFSVMGRHFPCVDQVQLSFNTAMLVFKSCEIVFTTAPTCDYCIHVMSALSRCYTDRPHAFHFGSHTAKKTGKRAGRGAKIGNSKSFWELAWHRAPRLPLMAQKYLRIRKTARNIFITDFEFVRRDRQGLPRIPTELTVRGWNGQIIVSCIINEKGMTNQGFHDHIHKQGFESKVAFQSVDRIRGPPYLSQPSREFLTPKEIIGKLREHGLGPDTFWVEWSTDLCDYKCLKALIEAAGEDADISMTLPRPGNIWPVIADFSTWLPGLERYKLGYIVRLMNPKHPALQHLHFSKADTSALHFLLETWLLHQGDASG